MVEVEDNRKKRNKVLFLIAIFFIVIGVVVGIRWLYYSQFQRSTDDAYVDGNMVPLMSQVSGTVIALYVDDTEYVKAGQTMVQLDTADAQQQLDQAKAALLKVATEVYSSGGTITDSRIASAKTAFKDAYTNLKRYTVIAPVDGYVAKRNVQLGQVVSPTYTMLVIVPLDQVWVEANFKETEINGIEIGVPATVTTDYYGSDIVFDGKVSGIDAGTGSVFALIPAQNATGNWIKIVQRIPVRISLDSKQVSEHILRLGLSSTVSIDIRDTPKPAEPRDVTKPLVTTSVYDTSTEEIDADIKNMLDKIFAKDVKE